MSFPRDLIGQSTLSPSTAPGSAYLQGAFRQAPGIAVTKEPQVAGGISLQDALDLTVRHSPHESEPSQAPPIEIDSAQLTKKPIATDRGLTDLPVWVLSAEGLSPITVLAVPPSTYIEPPVVVTPKATPLIGVVANRSELSVTWLGDLNQGSCAHKGRLAAAESATAVEIREDRDAELQAIPSASSSATGAFETYSGDRSETTTAVPLKSPLGNRVLIDEDGQPIVVGATGSPVQSTSSQAP